MKQYKRKHTPAGRRIVHRMVAAKKLKRELRPEEEVHHIDEDKLNNVESNLMVFKNKAEHSRWHSFLKVGVDPSNFFVEENGAFFYDYTKDNMRVCPICGGKTANRLKVQYCSKGCYTLAATKERNALINTVINTDTRPTKIELHKMIWNTPLTEIGKSYNVSDNAVKKWAQKHDIPLPGRGFWAKLYTKTLEGQTCPLPNTGS